MQRHHKRHSSHPYINTVWHTENLTDGVYNATPDGSWDLILCKDEQGRPYAFIAGQETKPQQIPYKARTESVVISFRPSVYVPSIASESLTDGVLMLENDGDQRFILGGVSLPYIAYLEAEALVDVLVKKGLISEDPLVDSVLQDSSTAKQSERTLQRRFKSRAGVTKQQYKSIKQSQEAVRQLKAGRKPVDAAAESGYYDQAHMARQIGKIMGRRPSDIDDIHKL
jgi:AraC-like DNA-binding protein